jgi:Xaa-Pro aminopeptidase
VTQRLLGPAVIAAAIVGLSVSGLAQAGRPFTTAFPKEEFAARRLKVAEAIGDQAVALVQAAPTVHSSAMFRQSNEFFYLTGVGVPQAMLLIDGATKKSTLYLPQQDTSRAAVEGALLSSDDPASVLAAAGIEDVKPTDALQADLAARSKEGRRDLFVPFQPAEGSAESRDGATRRNNDAAADPWDGRIWREAHLRVLLMMRAGNYVTRNLSPILDEMRAIKSAVEIAVIEKATRLGGEAIMEAMRSTAPGVAEHELDALARFIFVRHGAQGEAYRAIVASGGNAWFAHHRASDRVMADGDLVLMDYCPDLHYYRCDVTRQWPVNGTFSPVQRELYTFYLGVYEAILYSIKPNVTAQAILQEAVRKMDGMMAIMKFSKPIYETAAKQFVDGYRRRAQNTTGRGASLGHAVGMSTHDMGGGSGVMRPGLVFTIEPQFRIPEERIYLRLEDMIVITKTEARIISDFVPRSIDGVEKLIAEEGLLQQYEKIREPRSPH